MPWITFTDKSSGYCEFDGAETASQVAERITGKTVESSESLPYPANPIIYQRTHEGHGKCPAFCYSPQLCKGRISCPKSWACSE